MRPVLAPLLFVVLLGGARAPAPPALNALVFDGPLIEAHYAFYWLGARIGSSALSLRTEPAGYGVALTARTEGLLRSFVDARSQLEASGTGAPAQAQSRLFRTQSQVRKEALKRTVRFEADGRATVIERTLPKKGWGSAREAVPEALQTGPDPVAALLRLFARPSETEGAVRSFDGVQSVEYRYRCAAALEVLAPTARSPYAGPARKCTLAFEVIAGKAVDDEARKARVRDRERPPAQLWIARAEGREFWVPVRLEQAGRLGTVTGYLAGFGPGANS